MYKKRIVTVVKILFMISIIIAQDVDPEITCSTCTDVRKGFLCDSKFDNGNYEQSYLTTSFKKMSTSNISCLIKVSISSKMILKNWTSTKQMINILGGKVKEKTTQLKVPPSIQI